MEAIERMNPRITTFADLTTLKVGGAVDNVLRPDSIGALVSLMQAYDRDRQAFMILGGGSNVLAPSDAYHGIVIIPSFDVIAFETADENTVRVTADAGVVWDALVAESVLRGLWGFENLSAIPGTVGAAPIQNIGAYGADVSETIEWVETYDRTQRTIRRLTNAELEFSYRNSILKKERGRFAILRVSFLLGTVPKRKLSYKDLALRFGNVPEPSLAEIRTAVIEIRAGKFPDLDVFGTAGSFFMNPVLSEKETEKLLAEYPELPHFPAENGVKVSLAWILDNVIHAKGERFGGAFVWDKQPLVIATDDTATAHDVRELMRVIKKNVFTATGIRIVPEVFVMEENR